MWKIASISVKEIFQAFFPSIYPKPLNEGEGWIRVVTKVGRRYTFYNHCLRIIGCNFFKPHFGLKGSKEFNNFHLTTLYREHNALQEPTQDISEYTKMKET